MRHSDDECRILSFSRLEKPFFGSISGMLYQTEAINVLCVVNMMKKVGVSVTLLLKLGEYDEEGKGSDNQKDRLGLQNTA